MTTTHIFILATVALSVLSEKSANIQKVTKWISSVASDYKHNEQLSKGYKDSSKDSERSETLAFTYDSDIREHMISVGLQETNKGFSLNFYDAKAADLKKEFTYNQKLLDLEADAFKELIHRMVERPDTKINFTTLEDVIKRTGEEFGNLYSVLSYPENHVVQTFSSENIIVAVCDYSIDRTIIDSETEKSDFTINGKCQAYLENKKIEEVNISVSMFDDKGTSQIKNLLSKISSVKLYVNNLTDVAKALISVLQASGFTKISVPRISMINNTDYRAVVNMTYKNTNMTAVIDFLGSATPIGKYQLRIQTNQNLPGKLNVDLPDKDLDFTRQSTEDLKKMFEDLKLSDVEHSRYKDIIRVYKNAHKETFGSEDSPYSAYSFKEQFKEEKKTNFFYSTFNVSPTIVLNMTLDSISAGKTLCTFVYEEKGHDIKISYEVPALGIRSKYDIPLQDYDFDVVSQYVDMIVKTTYDNIDARKE